MRLPRWLLGAGSLRAMVLVVGGMSVLTFAQTADSLKARFARLLGAAKYAKLVWQDETVDGRKPNFDFDNGYWPSNSNIIKVMDTRDGIVRNLVMDSAGSHWSGSAFTWDGARVVYTDNMRKRVLAVNWDGTGKKLLLNGYDGDGRTYYTASDSKHWAMGSEYKSGTGSKFVRVNIDNPTETVTILSCSWTNVGWAGATCWTSISSNGKYVVGGFPNYGSVGILTVATGAVSYYSPTGCWPTIARDTTGDALYTSDGTDAHKAVTIVNKLGASTFHKALGTSVLGGANNEHEGLRWTTNRDYVTLWAYASGFVGAGIPNPRLVRISDLKWVAIVDNPSSCMGNMDVFFYDQTNAVDRPVNAIGAAKAVGKGIAGGAFDLCGRSVSVVQKGGVYVTVPTAGSVKPSIHVGISR